MSRWNQHHVSTLSSLVTRGETANYVSARLGRKPEAIRNKAKQLRINVRVAGRSGTSKWIAKEINRLGRQVQEVEDRSGSARSRTDSEALASRAERASRVAGDGSHNLA